jgi:hypothetical protein
MNRTYTGGQQAERPPVLMATVDSLPHPYQVLGLVDAAMATPSGIVPTASLMARLADKAVDMGADAVIGIRLSQLTLPMASRAKLIGRVTEHIQNTVVAVALGTAVRLLPAGGSSGIARPRPCGRLR